MNSAKWLVLWLLLFSFLPLEAENSLIKEGKLNLDKIKNTSFREIKLDGQWEFYWNELFMPDDFKKPDFSGKREFINVPGSWTNQTDYPSHGYGTMRLILSGLIPGKTYSLYIPEMLTSFRFFLDGEEVYGNGTVGRNRSESKAQFHPGIISFVSDEGTIEIVCQISNFNHRNSGIWRSIRLGDEKTVYENRIRKLLLEMFISTVLLAISFFHLGIYVYRTEAKAELLFGLTCLILFLRTITTGEQIINIIIPSFPWGLARRLEYMPFYLLAPVFMNFITSLFPKDSKKIFNRIFLIIFFLLGIFFVILPVRITNRAILPAEILLIFGIIYAFSVLIKAGFNKRDHAFPIIAAFTILALASVNDILFSQGFIDTMYLAPLGFIIFIIIQSQMLSARYALSFRKVHSLSLQLKGINESMSRFVPFQFLEYLKKNSILDVNLGDQVLENMTILFADIRSFTTLSEVMTPEENFKFLNSFLSQVVPVIREQGGFVDKFIGDAIMALFPYPPDKAVKAAIELQNAVKRYNAARNRAGYREISLGIGIHTGQLMLGTIGETNRMETTVIADAVNIASRLEQLTKVYGSKIIISRELFNKLESSEGITSRSLGLSAVKGKSLPIEIVEILDAGNNNQDQSKIFTINDFEKAIDLIKDSDFKMAALLFENILKKNPDDIAASFLLKHCKDSQFL